MPIKGENRLAGINDEEECFGEWLCDTIRRRNRTSIFVWFIEVRAKSIYELYDELIGRGNDIGHFLTFILKSVYASCI